MPVLITNKGNSLLLVSRCAVANHFKGKHRCVLQLDARGRMISRAEEKSVLSLYFLSLAADQVLGGNQPRGCTRR